VTAQNTKGVKSYYALPLEIIEDQLNAVFEDFEIKAVKTGMLANESIVEKVSELLRQKKVENLVVDPIISSSKGDVLLEGDAISVLAEHLFPLAMVVVPNIKEASAISGVQISNLNDAREAADKIYNLGARHVLIKGGHLEDKFSTDILFDGNVFVEFTEKRVDGADLHGSGCIFSSAIAAELAKGQTLENSIRIAKALITKKIINSS
jgi:hydroxymethylpyrimidine/phosphomethylpyrimidine kinase